MSSTTVRLLRRKDGCVTLRVNRYVESFDPTHLSKLELVDKVRWIFVTAGVSVSEETIRHLLRKYKLVA